MGRLCYDYNDRGQVTYAWGDVPYPESEQYNQFGDLTNLTTYRAGSGWTGATWPASTGTGDVTTWHFDEATGLLTSKADASGHAVTYNYYNTHQLWTRIWARGVGTTNIYRANGDFVRIDYSDGTSVNFTDDSFPYLNRFVKPDVVLDNAGTSQMTYDHAGRMVSTAYLVGLLSGITVTNHINPLYGRDLLQVLSTNAAPSTIYSAAYGYDSYGRMGSVSSGVYSATYGYAPNSDLLQSTTCKNNGSTVLTTTRAWDYGYRLRSIANVANGATVTSHSYLYDSLDRRTQATLEDGTVWKYNYNDRNELVGANRYWPDWKPVSGQQYGYDYDNIGNRTSASSGGDTSGANLRTTSYAANYLDQYTSITTPGYQSIIGAGLATDSVTVNSSTADRKGEYFHKEISIGNSSGPVWQTVSVTCGGDTTNGVFAFPANSSALTYDADGNLTFDGTWTYEWDPENRLAAMSMTNLAGIANPNRLRLEFTYDFLGRRMSKTVKTWNGGGFSNPLTTLFAYDAWNLATMLNSSLNPTMTFMWGRDLGGTIDKAGGVGGLLMSTFCGTSQTNFFVSYDGNGNITGLINASGGNLAARYEYSPYGGLLRSTAPMAQQNPMRVSTKFWDVESGLIYYSYRFYNPSIGRWINRDPTTDRVFLDLYLFCKNSPSCGVDKDGRDVYGFPTTDAYLQSLLDGLQQADQMVEDAAPGSQLADLFEQMPGGAAAALGTLVAGMNGGAGLATQASLVGNSSVYGLLTGTGAGELLAGGALEGTAIVGGGGRCDRRNFLRSSKSFL